MLNLYIENYKVILKEISNKWRDIPCSLIESLDIVKMLVSSKLIYRFYTVTINSGKIMGADLDKLFPDFSRKCKKIRKAKEHLKEHA